MAETRILSARWVLPVVPRGTVLEDHCVVVRGERIVEILPDAQARVRHPGAEWLEFPSHALLPGFVNAHTHAAMTLLRGVGGDLPLMEWLEQHVWPAEARLLSAEFVDAGSRLAVAEMIRGGTTCFSDMYLFPEETARVVDASGIRAALGLTVIDFPTPWARTPGEYFDKGAALVSAWQGHPRIGFTVAPHAPYTVGDDSLRKIRARAEALGVAVHMHVHETAHEVSSALAEHGERPLQRLARLGLLEQPLAAVHMTQLDEHEHERLPESLTSVVHCPESNLKLASGFCPVARLLGNGVNVALGTDGVASNNDLDMLGEMRTAALLAKGVSGDATAVSASQALEMATLNGARALGLEAQIGSLEPGKYADLIAIDLGGLEFQPAHDPHAQIVYAATRDAVSDVFVAGQPLLRGRELRTLDLDELGAMTRIWQERVQAAH
ncbi:TRZ/ATZ family hydrolase [Thioalkalivibrio paradoxus]|uniref:5-methylthioadenosine/S-adenosylhomocysteine deaminase n=1 Tax=Thioalkalivibrio paradoxus ARh 1 TaxID=713585 RepID=W0DMA7_9GAMM|nr:TRZ/ATZ family hydrolase [Thioalkalivibrio paradoxus]AHE98392.1 N-ethylammeline chlorohydrolase [Thioalkalivibrio paradoxus ARh 1]